MSTPEGYRTYQFDHCLTGDVECFAHEGGLFTLYDAGKGVSVSIDPIGMTAEELDRAMVAGNTVLARAEPVIGRHERRKRQALN